MIGRALIRGAGELRDSVATLAGPPEWLIDALGGAKSVSGIPVTEESALRLGAVFACVRAVSETVADLPCIIYERTGPKSRERADYHPYAPALRVSPNPEMTAFEYWENLTAYAMLWGRQHAYMNPRRNGTMELWPIPPNMAEPVRANLGTTDKPIPSALIGLNVTVPGSGEVRFVPWRKLLGFRAFGYSTKTPIARHRETIGLGLAAEEFASRFFSQNGNVSGFIRMPTDATPDQADRTEARFRSRHEGLDRAHLVGLLEGGAEWQSVGIPLKDAQYIEGREFGVDEIARMFRVPPHKIASLRRATFSNIEEQNIEWVTDTIGPWLSRHEQAQRAYLFGTKNYGQTGDVYSEFLVDKLLRGNIEARYKAYAVGVQFGWLSRNDVRELENRPPVEGLDEFLYPINLARVGHEGDALDPADPDTQNSLKLASLLARSLRSHAGGGVDLYDPDKVVHDALNGNRPDHGLPSPIT